MAPLQTAFVQASHMLQRYRQYWDFNAFSHALAGLSSGLNSELSADLSHRVARLNALDEPDLWLLDNSPQAQADFFGEQFPLLFEWLKNYTPPQVSAPITPVPFWLHAGIPGRKWQQIQRFSAVCDRVIAPTHATQPALEWCAGKGYLGRLLSWQHPQSVFSLERQGTLCRQGQQHANALNIAQHFIQADIHHLPIQPQVAPIWVALHACGDLHREFIVSASTHTPQFLAMAPCCYHRQHGEYYNPLSQLAQAHNLPLNALALRLAQQDQVTAGQRERIQRAQILTWRLGYEHLRQHAAPNTPYRPLPSVKNHQFNDFQDFCAWAAAQHNLQLKRQTTASWQQAEAQGQSLRLNMMRHDAIRHCFRRALELWLLMDKALYLQQHHYTVQLHRFCESTLTPRNLLLTATYAQ